MITDYIYDALRRCEKEGRKPVLILINPETYSKTLHEHYKKRGLVWSLPIQKIYGINIITTSLVKDFFIIDDRSWAEQEFK